MIRNIKQMDLYVRSSIQLNPEYDKLVHKHISPSVRTKLNNAIDDTIRYLNDTFKQTVCNIDKRTYKDIPLTSTLFGHYDEYINDVEFSPNNSDKTTLYTPIDKINFDLNNRIIKNNVLGYRCILHNISFCNPCIESYYMVGILGVPSIIFASYGLVIDGTVYQHDRNDEKYLYTVCDRYSNTKPDDTIRYYINDCFIINNPNATYSERLEFLYEVINDIKIRHPFIYNVFFKNLDVSEDDILGYKILNTEHLHGTIIDTFIEGKHLKGVNIYRKKAQYHDMKPIKVCDCEEPYVGIIKDIILNVPKDSNIKTLHDDVLGYIILDVSGITIPLYRQDTLLRDIQTFNEFKELYAGAIIGFKYRDDENKKDPYITSRIEFE